MDRPELREKTWEAIRPLATHYVLSYISNLKQFDVELGEQINKVADQILALLELPKDKPPLLSDGDIESVCISSLGLRHQTYISPLEFGAGLAIAKAQREADIKHYERG